MTSHQAKPVVLPVLIDSPLGVAYGHTTKRAQSPAVDTMTTDGGGESRPLRGPQYAGESRAGKIEPGTSQAPAEMQGSRYEVGVAPDPFTLLPMVRPCG
jgi:hypothetical protein